MPDDILGRAQQALNVRPCRDCGLTDCAWQEYARLNRIGDIAPELIDALRAARTENERLRGELAATKALLESTQQGHSETIRDFCTLRDALPREQVEQLLGGAPDDR